MKKIGISIPWDYLAENIVTEDGAAINKVYGHSNQFLKILKDLKVTHIELRHRKKNISEMDMANVFKRLLDFNLSVTIHGDILQTERNQSITDIFPWFEIYKKINRSENPVMVTLHPVTGTDQDSLPEYNNQTVALIRDINEIIAKEELPLKLALENQRNKADSIAGTSFKDIENMWKKINGEHVGICWDMGHCVANNRIDSIRYPLYPHSEFTAAAVHTHIHDIGPDGKTHWFFKENIVPLSDFIQSLKAENFKGVYNLELSFSRFKNENKQREQLEKSILKLRDLI